MADLAFTLFLLVNAAMILRPSELVPALAVVPIYELLILAACAVAYSSMRQRWSKQALLAQPISICVVGIFLACVMSHLTHFYLFGIKESGILFLKTLVYYVLLVSVVDTPKRLRRFLLSVAVLSTAMVSLCAVDYLGWFDLQFINHITERDGFTATNADNVVLRMRGSGIFSDPNDISLLIVATGVLCLYFLNDSSRGWLRLGWIAPLLILGVALVLTRSRGGLLAAGGAGVALVLSRYGRRTAIAAAVLGLCLLPLIAGRQGSIDIASGTGHARILLWREGLAAIKSANFFFGIGHGLYVDLAGLVAHNSFVHAYVELGFFGGTLFFGCFFFIALALFRIGGGTNAIPNLELARMRPYIAAVVAAWATGLLTLSRCYVVPTYMVIGVASCYLNLVAMNLQPPRPLTCWDRKHLLQLAVASVGMLFCIYAFVYVVA